MLKRKKSGLLQKVGTKNTPMSVLLATFLLSWLGSLETRTDPFLLLASIYDYAVPPQKVIIALCQTESNTRPGFFCQTHLTSEHARE